MLRNALILFSLLYGVLCQAQSGEQPIQVSDLPVLKIDAVTDISAHPSFEDQCFEHGILGHNGRIWLEACYHLQNSFSTHFQVYDGEGIHDVPLSPELQRLAVGKLLRIRGADQKGNILCSLVEKGKSIGLGINTTTGESFLIRDTTHFLLNFYLDGEEELALYLSQESIELFDLSGDTPVLQREFDLPFPDLFSKEHNFSDVKIWGINEAGIWLYSIWQDAYLLEPGSKTAKLYPSQGIMNNFDRYSSLHDTFPDTLRDQDNWPDVEGFNLYENSIFTDRKNEQIAKYVSEDYSFFLVYKNAAGKVFRLQIKGLSEVGPHDFVMGSDFSKSFIYYRNNKLLAARIRTEQVTAASWSELSGCREIIELSPDHYLSRGEENFALFSSQSKELDLKDTTCLKPLLLQNSIVVNSQLVLSYNEDMGGISAYNLKTGECEQVFQTSEISRMDWLDKDHILVLQESTPSLLNLSTKTIESLATNQTILEDGYVQHSLVDGKTWWLASRNGLVKVDIASGEMNVYGSETLPDKRIQHIDLHPDGTLWLSTYAKGIVVFDPASASIVRSITRAEGLSNNTVVGSLRDELGYVWAATYRGLNLIDPQGFVIGSFFEADGLTHHEFNRNSILRTSDGKLIFGTVQGLNLIDPRQVIGKFTAEKPKIFAASATYVPLGERQSSTNFIYGNPKEIVLPAYARNIRLNFGMSSLIQQEDNRYSYRILKGGASKEWNFIGSKTNLRLENLPSGKYNIEISGRDYRGNISESLLIPLKVRQYFYKNPRFYMLLASIFTLIGLGWIYYLRSTKKQLEMVVRFRSKQIETEGELIQMQQEELRFWKESKTLELGAEDQQWLEEVEGVVAKSISKGEELTVSKLADTIFLSERQLRRKLIATTGFTPSKYLLEMRLAKARFLLENHHYETAAEVAYAVGFGSATHFSRAYSSRYGRTPGSYFEKSLS